MKRKRSTKAVLTAPSISLSESEYLVPLTHSSKAQLRHLHDVLNHGDTFYIKAMGTIARRAAGEYVLFAKLRCISTEDRD